MELSHFSFSAAAITAAIPCLSYMSNQPISACGAIAIASSLFAKKRGSTQPGRRLSTSGRMRPDRTVIVIESPLPLAGGAGEGPVPTQRTLLHGPACSLPQAGGRLFAEPPLPAERIPIHHLDPRRDQFAAQRIGCGKIPGGTGVPAAGERGFDLVLGDGCGLGADAQIVAR